MPLPTPDLPFAYRLPSDAAAQIHGTPALDVPLVETGAPRRRLVVLVLLLVLVGSGLAGGFSSGSAQALRGEDCRPGWVVDAVGTVTRDENRLC
jgi:hypothetical protein